MAAVEPEVVSPGPAEVCCPESPPENRDNYQGPHNWRKQLKPVSSPTRECEDGQEEEDNQDNIGDSPVAERWDLSSVLSQSSQYTTSQ